MIRRVLWCVAPALVCSLFAACEDSSSSTEQPSLDGGGVDFDGGSGSDAPSSSMDTGAPPAEGGTDGGGDADEDAGPPPLVPDYFVDPVAGADTNDGKTKGTAFKTICKAKDVAQANQVVGLLDGSYDNTNQRPPNWVFTYPCGPSFNVAIKLTAVNAGKAIVKVPMVLDGGGEIRGLHFEFDTDSNGTITAQSGTLVLRDVTYGAIFSPPNAKVGALSVSGTAKVTVIPGTVANYTTVPVPDGKALVFGFVTGTGELTIEGGTFDDSAAANGDSYCSPLFEGGGKLTLKNVTARHKGSIVRATNMTLAVTGGSLDSRSIAPNTGCMPAIGLLGTVSVTVSGTTFVGGSRNAFGPEVAAGGTLSLTNVTASGFTDAAIDLNAFANQPLAFSMRGSMVKNNAIGLRLAGNVVADLGTAASPGNNTIDGNTTRGLDDSATAIVDAAGNTWTPNQQNADGAGKYAASLETGPASGVNYSLATANQQIQF